jgi:ABC-type spermidine/putrescine transport system permease subunit I
VIASDRSFPGSRRVRLLAWLALAPILIYYGLLFVGPLTYARVFRFTIELASGVTIISVALAYPFAYALTRLPRWLWPILLALVLLPFWTSVMVRTFTWMVLLERNGLVNQALVDLGLVSAPLQLLRTNLAVYIGLVHYVLPFAIVTLFGFLRRIDPTVLRSAQVLGARPWQAFLWVYLPLNTPGLMTTSLLIFVLTIGFYITPAILGGLSSTTVPMLIEQQIHASTNWHFASALTVLLLVVVWGLNGLAERYGGVRGLIGRSGS